MSMAFEHLILLYLVSVANHLSKRKATSAHVLPATRSIVGLEGQTVVRAFMVFSKTAVLGSVSQLMDPYL